MFETVSAATSGTYDGLPTLSELVVANERLASERDEYKQLYVALLEAYRRLQAGLHGQKREVIASAVDCRQSLTS